MKGNERIAEILTEEYGIASLEPFEEIEYEIERYSEKVSRVKIRSKTGRMFCCPVYAMFDGYHMSWYGDYGFWGFDCTWETDVTNLAYNSPYYQLEKLVSRNRTEFNDEQCENELMMLIKRGDWYKYDLTDEQKKRFDEFMKKSYDYIGDADEDCLYEHDELCEKLKELKNATVDESDWRYRLRWLEFTETDFYSIFGCEEYEMYNIGNKEPCRFFIILYMLSVVANTEKSLQAHPTEKGGAE